MHRLIFFIALSLVILSCSKSQKMTETHKYTNHLIHENSPYLLQHAHNPVDWHPWNEAALEKAKKENKMLIISVGYAACHWCHVMEHESYEDSAVAAIMNKHFINIKVDREERPDIDDIYMSACHLTNNRSCGWPLNAFALPDGRPVWAGTYFPKEQWIRILNQFIDYKENNADKLEDAAENIMQGIRQMDQLVANEENEALDQKMLENIKERFIRSIDMKSGGRSGQPKFPLPNNYQFLLQYYDLFKDQNALEAVDITLLNMANGGINDQLGGGFARYSTDADWFAPHFEKMLYDNAQLVSLYAEAYQLSGNKLYGQTVEKTLEFIQRELTSETGGFYSSLDADSEGEEGKFYVWTAEEIKVIITDSKKREIFNAYYNVHASGNWEHGNNILYVDQDSETIAKKFKITTEELGQILEDCAEKMMDARAKRIRPGLDDKILTSWNGLMIKGFVDAYKALGDKSYLTAAENSIRFIIDNMMAQDGRLSRSYKDGQVKINAFLDDYATIISAFMALYEVSFDESYLERARVLMDYAIAHFYDEESSTFFYTSDLDPPLITRKTELNDNVIPGSVSMMAKNIFLLSEFYSNEKYRKISKKLINKLTPTLQKISEPSYYSNWLSLALYEFENPFEIVITGPEAGKFRDQLNKSFLPNSIVLGAEHNSALPLMQNKIDPTQTMIYVCKNKVCQLPVDNVKDALKQIAEFDVN
jgi:uncharacterized protein YyaL (SSP411 family)